MSRVTVNTGTVRLRESSLLPFNGHTVQPVLAINLSRRHQEASAMRIIIPQGFGV